MKRVEYTVIIGIVALLLYGCGAVKSRQNSKMAETYVAAAKTFETEHKLPEALEQYQLALTADPENTVARQGRDRLSRQLAQLADERYRLGMKYYRQGKYNLAKKEFLTALRFRPDHPEASKILINRQSAKVTSYVFHVIQEGESLSQIAKTYYGDTGKYKDIAMFNNLPDATRIRPGQRIMIPDIEGTLSRESQPEKDKGYVDHVIQPGETISKLAKKYYGDYKQFHIIAQYNDLDDATRISVGQAIKIPKVAGLPFNRPSASGEEAPLLVEDRDLQPPPQPVSDLLAEGSDHDEEIDEQLMAYRDTGIELFNQGKYEDAIFELVKAVEAMPGDAQTLDYLSRSYVEAGKQLLDKKEYNAAKESFEAARQYDPDCTQCSSLIEQSELAPLLAMRDAAVSHYKTGDYQSAIADMTYYLERRPDDVELRAYISDAYYQTALEQYEKGAFKEAKEGFESALEYDNTCSKCDQYIEQSLANYKEAHYNKGIAFFGKEQLPEAISEWQTVFELDPEYKDVAVNLRKAKDLLEKLEKIRRSQSSKP